MNYKPILLLSLLIGFSFLMQAQSNDSDKQGITWSGFVKVDYMFDSRQTISAREGHFNIAPAPENIDAITGEDLNAQSNFNILAIQSRLKGTIKGPEFFGMKTAGVIEAAFFGNSNGTTGEFRLRHAFVKLSNDNIDILMGQYWHPMFVTAVFPGTYSFNTGVPFQAFSRNPQLRVATKGTFKFIGVLFTERDFKTRGASVSQAGVPQLHAQFQYGSPKTTVAGVGINYKTSRPALGTKNLASTSGIGYFRTKLGDLTFKAEATYGQNMTDVLQIGGFATDVNGDFVNNTTLSTWAEFSGNFTDSMEWGLFGGYTENQGYGKPVTYVDGFLGNNLQNQYRVAPRIGWKSGKMKIGVEGEFTTAQFASIDSQGALSTTGINAVSNFRLLTTAIYKF